MIKLINRGIINEEGDQTKQIVEMSISTFKTLMANYKKLLVSESTIQVIGKHIDVLRNCKDITEAEETSRAWLEERNLINYINGCEHNYKELNGDIPEEQRLVATC